MSLEQALVARVAATSSLVALIGTRFYAGVAVQNATRPYVVFDTIGGEGRARTMGDGVNLVRQRVQMTVVATTVSSEIDVHAALLTAFDWWSGTLGGTEVHHASAEGAKVVIDSEQTLPDTRVTSQDFMFAYRE